MPSQPPTQTPKLSHWMKIIGMLFLKTSGWCNCKWIWLLVGGQQLDADRKTFSCLTGSAIRQSLQREPYAYSSQYSNYNGTMERSNRKWKRLCTNALVKISISLFFVYSWRNIRDNATIALRCDKHVSGGPVRPHLFFRNWWFIVSVFIWFFFYLLFVCVCFSYAPWCPACKNLASAWEKLGSWSDDLNIKTARIDVTTSPALSGRFLVTALPTIYQ